jgi:hypothetical protein
MYDFSKFIIAFLQDLSITRKPCTLHVHVRRTSNADVECIFSLAHEQLHVFMKQIVVGIKNISVK